MACQSCKWVRTETSWRSPVVLAQLAGFCSLPCYTVPPATVASARLRQQQAGSVIQQRQIFDRKSWGNISILTFQPGQLLSPRLPRIFILLLERKKKGFKRAVSAEDSRADLCPSLVSFHTATWKSVFGGSWFFTCKIWTIITALPKSLSVARAKWNVTTETLEN